MENIARPVTRTPSRPGRCRVCDYARMQASHNSSRIARNIEERVVRRRPLPTGPRATSSGKQKRKQRGNNARTRSQRGAFIREVGKLPMGRAPVARNAGKARTAAAVGALRSSRHSLAHTCSLESAATRRRAIEATPDSRHRRDEGNVRERRKSGIQAQRRAREQLTRRCRRRLSREAQAGCCCRR